MEYRWQSRNVAWHDRDPVCGWRADPVQMSIQTPMVPSSNSFQIFYSCGVFQLFLRLNPFGLAFFSTEKRENYVRDCAVPVLVPRQCVRCVKGIMYRSNLQRPLSLGNTGNIVVVYIGIFICASYRHIALRFALLQWLLSVRFRFNLKYQLAFFGSLILGLWFVRSFQISSTPRKVRSVYVSSHSPASVVSVQFGSEKEIVKVSVVVAKKIEESVWELRRIFVEISWRIEQRGSPV